MNAKRSLALLLLCTPAVLIVVFVGLSSTRRGRESLKPVMDKIESTADHLNQLGRRAVEFPEKEEIEAGNQLAALHAQKYTVLDKNDTLSSYIAGVGRILTASSRRRIPFHFAVITSSEINAYALPGGHIYVTTALLNTVESEAELAAVLGHEIGHVDLFHCADKIRYSWAARKKDREWGRFVESLADFAERGYSERQEEEADRNGLLLAAQSGYHPQPAIDFFIKLTDTGEPSRPESAGNPSHRGLDVLIREAAARYRATHPALDHRIDVLKQEVERHRAEWSSRSFYIGKANFKERKTRPEKDVPGEWIKLK